MATTFSKICSIMKAEDLKFRVHPKKNEALVLLSTREFKNVNDDKMVPVLVTLLEKGEFVKILAPSVFNLHNCKHPQSLSQALLEMSFKTKMLRWELDGKDGEIRASVDIPLENSKLKKNQFLRSLFAVPVILDQYYLSIKEAMDNGVVDIKRSGLPLGNDSKPLELADLMRLAGGVMGLRQLLKDAGKL